MTNSIFVSFFILKNRRTKKKINSIFLSHGAESVTRNSLLELHLYPSNEQVKSWCLLWNLHHTFMSREEMTRRSEQSIYTFVDESVVCLGVCVVCTEYFLTLCLCALHVGYNRFHTDTAPYTRALMRMRVRDAWPTIHCHIGFVPIV